METPPIPPTPNQAEEQLKALSEMRDLMNKSSRFISMSGLAGVAAGTVGLIGVVIIYLMLEPYFFHWPLFTSEILSREGMTSAYASPRTIQPLYGLIRDIIMIAGLTLALALTGAWYFTQKKAKKLGQSMWDETAKRMTINMLIPLIAGGGFALVMLVHGIIGLVPAITLAFYGTALINASKYTLNDIRYLGVIEIVLSLVAALFYEYSLIIWAIGFGVMHIIYGIFLYLKYEHNKKTG
jgi:hypothetical protein